jgi:hypothetical protein
MQGAKKNTFNDLTPRVMDFLVIFIRFVIKHETLWLIKP